MRIGDKLKGVVTGLQPYGAFVELETGVTGLIHISEIREQKAVSTSSFF